MTIRPSWRAIRWAAFFLVYATVVALVGYPQPVAILTAGAGWLTGALILFRGFEP